jgi:oxygen-dependent protoporphyrinogen oxidase
MGATHYDVVIVGAGVAGLQAAWRLRREHPTWRVALLEADADVGGAIRTECSNGFVIEEGPESLLADKPEVMQWLAQLGLQDEVIHTSSEHRGAYVLRQGRLVRIPEGFRLLGPTQLGSLVTSRLLSWRGMMRVAAEMWVPPRRRGTQDTDGNEGDDESLADFVTRRFGRELLDRLVQPLAGGIYGADPRMLSMRATFPRFVQMERQAGSVIRGLRREMREGQRDVARDAARGTATGARYGLFVSLRQGLGTLVQTLGRYVRDVTHVHCAVTRVAYDAESRVWEIACAGGADMPQVVRADAVVLALPARVASRLVRESQPALAQLLARVEYGSTAIVTYAWPRSAVAHPLDAFGFVSPATEQRVVMASTWSSIKYPNRAPRDHVLLRAYVGGFGQRHLCTLPPDTLDARVRAELEPLLGIRQPPTFRRLHRYIDAMPVYKVGHLQWRAAVDDALADVPSLALAGTAYDGVGIPAVVSSADRAVERVVRALGVQDVENARNAPNRRGV